MPNKQAVRCDGAIAAIVVAAGSGSRMGLSEPKQFLPLGGRPVLSWSIETLLAHNGVRRIVVVLPPGTQAQAGSLLRTDDRIVFAAGGAQRTDSVRAGLAVLASEPPEFVLVHDAARPGVSVEVIDELLVALQDAEAAAPALVMTDALKRRDSETSVSSVDRDNLFRVQTPQAFRYSVLWDAYRQAQGAFVDDLALVEAAGARIRLTTGRQALMKITHAEDMMLAERILAGNSMRIGSGFDVHGFEPGEFVTLCGVRIAHNAGLRGHSDADVAWHALTDAILGALALGDIGDHFPPSDPQWKGAPSVIFLKHAMGLASDLGWQIANIDLTVICEAPKIAPHREAMRLSTSQALSVDIQRVSVKATTTEKLGFTGRKEGVAAQAVVLLQRK